MEIYTEVLNEEIIFALKGDDIAKWRLFSTLEGDKKFREAFQAVKWGVKYQFNIEKIVKGMFEERAESNNVRIKGYRKFSLDEFWDEMTERRKIMEDVLRSLFKEIHDKQGEWKDDK